MINRREFLGTITAAAVLPALGSQEPQANEWGVPVFDLHFHLRAQPAGSAVTAHAATATARASARTTTRLPPQWRANASRAKRWGC